MSFNDFKYRDQTIVRKLTAVLFTTLKRKRQGGIKLDDEDVRQEQTDEKDTYNVELAKKVLEEEDQKKEEIEKKKVDDLWAAFKADVDTPKQKPKPVVKSSGFCSLTSVVKVKNFCTQSFKAFINTFCKSFRYCVVDL